MRGQALGGVRLNRQARPSISQWAEGGFRARWLLEPHTLQGPRPDPTAQDPDSEPGAHQPEARQGQVPEHRLAPARGASELPLGGVGPQHDLHSCLGGDPSVFGDLEDAGHRPVNAPLSLHGAAALQRPASLRLSAPPGAPHLALCLQLQHVNRNDCESVRPSSQCAPEVIGQCPPDGSAPTPAPPSPCHLTATSSALGMAIHPHPCQVPSGRTSMSPAASRLVTRSIPAVGHRGWAGVTSVTLLARSGQGWAMSSALPAPGLLPYEALGAQPAGFPWGVIRW